MPLLSSRLLSFRSRARFPPWSPELQPPACGQREELALEGPHAFYFTELPLLRGQKSRSCLQSCCVEGGGGGKLGRGWRWEPLAAELEAFAAVQAEPAPCQSFNARAPRARALLRGFV